MMSSALRELSYPQLFLQYPAGTVFQFQQVRLCFSRDQSSPDSEDTHEAAQKGRAAVMNTQSDWMDQKKHWEHARD